MINSSRRQMLCGALAAVAALLNRASGGAGLTFGAKNGPDFSGGATPVKLLPECFGEKNAGDVGEWRFEFAGRPVSLGKKEVGAYIWEHERWCPILAVTEFDNKTVLWYETRAIQSDSRLLECEIGCAWAAESVTAMFGC